jgi:hypothetical protein
MLMYLIKGADLVCGLDSGIAQMAVALGTPAVILVGSVDLKLRYVDFDKIEVVQGECPKEELKHCYHKEVASQTGVQCAIDPLNPPCSQHNEYAIIKAANKLLNI